MSTLYNHTNFPLNLRRIREDKNWTQKTLADNAGLPVAVISFYETGIRSPGIENLCSICNALKVAPSIILSDEEDFHDQRDSNFQYLAP